MFTDEFGYYVKNLKSIFLFQIEVISNETVLASTITFSPTPEDDNHLLKCQALNPKIPGSTLEDSITLNVVCKYTLILLWA